MPKPGSTSARGYGRRHQVEREDLAPLVDAGQAMCTEIICVMSDRWIAPGTPWDLAHDRASGGYLGPAHRTCNRVEGGRWRHAKKRAPETPSPNRWIL